MLKLLHTSDLQLDAPFEFLAQKGRLHRQLPVTDLQEIAELAGSGNYDMLLIAGDLFNDNRPSHVTVNSVIQMLADVHIPVCILPGNHDCYEKTSVYRKASFPPNVQILSETPSYLDFPDLDLTIAGNTILTRHGQKSSLEGITRKGNRRWFVVLAHGNLQIPGLVKRPRDRFNRTKSRHAEQTMFALGDWHTFRDYSQRRVKAFYSGGPEPTALDQNGSGFVASIALSERGVEVQPIRVGTVESDQLTLDVTGLSEQEVLEKIKARAKSTLMLNVTLTGMVSIGQRLDPTELEEAAAEAFYLLRVSDESQLEIAKIDPSNYPEVQVIGQYVRMLSEKLRTVVDEKKSESQSKPCSSALRCCTGTRCSNDYPENQNQRLWLSRFFRNDFRTRVERHQRAQRGWQEHSAQGVAHGAFRAP